MKILTNISEDRAIAVFEEPGDDEKGLPCAYERLLTEEYREITTTPNMIRRALDEFGGEDIIFFGVGPVHPEVFDSCVVRIQGDKKKTVLLAGRGEVR